MKAIIIKLSVFIAACFFLSASPYAESLPSQCSDRDPYLNVTLQTAAGKNRASLCGRCCNFEGGKDHCVKCGKWLGASEGTGASLCGRCYNFEGGKDHCVKCGKWLGASERAEAPLCGRCYNFEGGKDHCIKCGKWSP